MKKIYLLLAALMLAPASWATYKTGYYDALNGKKRETLKAAVKSCVSSHTQLNYTDLPNHWIYTDIYPDLYQGQRRWWDMYSNEIYLIRNSQSGLQSFRDNKMQREHSVPKSWWGGENVPTPAYTDIYNLYPSDGPANQAKSNYPLGPVGKTSFNNGVTKVGTPVSGYGGSAGNVFEPADEYKGDFARAYFYVFTVYDDLNWTTGSMGAKNSWPTLKPWAYQMLLEWAQNDPVSQKEITRNDAAEKQQGNRNPFIDFPELAEYIWGRRVNEAFYVDQQGSQDPPVTGDPELTSPVDGEVLDLGQAAVGAAVSAPLLIDGKNLTSPLSLRIIGTDRAMFSTEGSSVPAASVNAEGGFRLNITYKPTSVGKHTATLILYDGGFAAGQQFSVTLSGEGFAVPELTALTAYLASDITFDSYTASWSESAQVADFYVLTRTRYLESGPVTSTYQTPDTEYTFDDRDDEVEESYFVQSSRLGYLSPKSNTVMVPAGNSGIGAVESVPMLVGSVEGGFVALNADGIESVRVLDMQGRTVASRSRMEYGEAMMLPQGIYMVVSASGRKPAKILVR